MKPSKYYNGDELLSRHYMINMVCGSRFGGKSTWAQRYVIKRAIRDHENQFAIIVRYDGDKGEMCPSYFTNTLMMWYPDYEIEYKTGKYYMKRKDTDEKWLAGYVFALNRATKMKSSSYPLIKTLILEEFINLEDKYIKNAQNPDLEVQLLISIIQTIFRGNGKQFRDDGRVFCISNSYSLNNPYFRYFRAIDIITKDPFKRFYNIPATKNKDGLIESPAIFIERVDNDVQDGLGMDNAGSKWTDFRNELRIVKNPKVKNVSFQLTFDNRLYINIAKYNESVICTMTDKPNNSVNIYSCSEVRRFGIFHINTLKSNPIYKSIDELFGRNEIYYDKLETYMTLYNILSF